MTYKNAASPWLCVKNKIFRRRGAKAQRKIKIENIKVIKRLTPSLLRRQEPSDFEFSSTTSATGFLPTQVMTTKNSASPWLCDKIKYLDAEAQRHRVNIKTEKVKITINQMQRTYKHILKKLTRCCDSKHKK
ncbi:hypothetical protein MNBD_GAMMA08-1711 [hydrothermal vent metagenome]|uniref:Uncharacterized protein n=1 Tax=hydrothermal vent metagenome TaxID=652676 RepID=A0A3B0WZB9_9ZZZZ